MEVGQTVRIRAVSDYDRHGIITHVWDHSVSVRFDDGAVQVFMFYEVELV